MNTNLETQKPEPTGLGGWLILPAISIIFTPIGQLFSLADIFVNYSGTIELLGPYMETSMLLTVYYYGSILFEIALLFYSIFLLLAFFRKKKSAPDMFIGLLLVMLTVSILDMLAWSYIAKLFPNGSETGAVADTGRSLIRAGISAMIWIPYFRLSRRVKNTFVR